MSEFERLVSLFITNRATPQETYDSLIGVVPRTLLDQAFSEFQALVGRSKLLKPPHMLINDDEDDSAATWFPGADSIQDAKFWPELKNHWLIDKQWPDPDVNSIHAASDQIVSRLETPWASSIKTRGLVVGYVQSGKTANFTAVIAKAADAGYRFFIVLSGTKRSLRSQTQKRLERELVYLNRDLWFTPTSERDFHPIDRPDYFLVDQGDKKVLCVVKKNDTILGYLISWLRGASKDTLSRCPFLIIDDEADEASVNTARNQAARHSDSDRSTINRHLVALLSLLPKAAYIAYTATPFANVFVDPSSPNDLYPRHFIYALPKPNGHFGTEQVFGRERLLDDSTDSEFEGIDVVRLIPDEEISLFRTTTATYRDFVSTVTPSLTDAVHYFWMACAARFVRGQNNEHATMLVHTTPHIRVHNDLQIELAKYCSEFVRDIQGPKSDLIRARLRDQWVSEMSRAPSSSFGHMEVQYDDLEMHLMEVITRTKVVVDNSDSENRLSYDEPGKIQIVIGGNTLSRGLTLEGLIVSFFVRYARAYDTLLQMGRWFGYRHGYEDLPRMWMTEDLHDYFYDLATVEEEIRQDISRYAQEGISPSQFGIRVRTHPDLAITARAKMQLVVNAQVSYSEKRQQTVLFDHKDKRWLDSNLKATSEFIDQIQKEGLEGLELNGHIIFYSVPVKSLLKYLGRYNFHSKSSSLNSKLLSGYINAQNNQNQLLEWNVVIRGLRGARSGHSSLTLGGLEVPLLERARRKTPSKYAHIGVLMSRGDIGVDLSDQDITPVQESDDSSDDSLDVSLQKRRSVEFAGIGLLVIYPINKDSSPASEHSEWKTRLDAVQHVIGLGIVFPKAEGNLSPQSYVTVDPRRLDDSMDDWQVEEEEGIDE